MPLNRTVLSNSFAAATQKVLEAGGTRVRYRDGNGLIARVGARLSGVFGLDGGRRSRPYIEANYWYNQNVGKLRMDSDLVPNGAPRSYGEIKIGMLSELTQNLQLWGQVVAQTGSHNYNSVGGEVGVKYTW